jgi:hypothetical protein
MERMAIVAVDPETVFTELLDYVVAEDCGTMSTRCMAAIKKARAGGARASTYDSRGTIGVEE